MRSRQKHPWVSIEAARAGEAGKSFAVVAGEVQKLADDCIGASKRISDIVKNITEQMSKAEVLINAIETNTDRQLEKLGIVNDSVAEIIMGIIQISDSANTINAELGSLHSVKAGIGSAVENLSAISEENAASSEETASSSSELTNSIMELSRVAEDIESSAEALQESTKVFRNV